MSHIQDTRSYSHSTASSGSLMESIDARTKLAGTNRLEMLLFTLGIGRTGNRETYGINVFKVREVLAVPPITAAPDMPPAVKGFVSLRGVVIPVIDLSEYCGIQNEGGPKIMIVTEYNRGLQAFLVEGVDTILRLDWTEVRTPPGSMAANDRQGLLVGIAEVQERLILMIDVEKILGDLLGSSSEREISMLEPLPEATTKTRASIPATVLYADDSAVARKAIGATLDKLGLANIPAINGRLAWQTLCDMADKATGEGRKLVDYVPLVITDAEMPEMDGYVLTKHIREDHRMEGVRVVMFSSLSCVNTHLGKSVGVDEYIPKMSPAELADSIRRNLGQV